ncbi:hypothetical protein, partial [Streptomyces glomeratus]|uniref:hypothetical protein n=1 Tax=Streptomyces glomeratus TaxID=284452 RepID=UPI0031E0F5B6
PFDLTEAFGEAWCVTMTSLPVEETLHHMGVPVVTELPDGLRQVSQRLADAASSRDRAALLLAKPASGTTMVLELEGLRGWIGSDADVLAALSAPDGIACSIMSDPNQSEAMVARAGRVQAGLDTLTGRPWGTLGDDLIRSLGHLGFRAAPGDDAFAVPDQWNSSQCAALVLQATTGVRLTTQHCSDPWVGGLSRRPDLG